MFVRILNLRIHNVGILFGQEALKDGGSKKK